MQADTHAEQPMENPDSSERRAGKFTIVIAILLTLTNFPVALALAPDKDPARWGEIAGYSIVGPVMLGLIIVVLFLLFKRFRNQSSRWKICSWT